MNNLELKQEIDLRITNKIASESISNLDIAEPIKKIIDYIDQEVQEIELLEGPRGAQGEQGIQGIQGVQGIQGPVGGTNLTNDTLPGGTFSEPVPITVDVFTTNIADNSNTYYSVPDYTNDQTKIGKRIIIRNPSIYGAIIKGTVNNTTFYTNTSNLPNGYESFESPLTLRSRRATELIYLGNIGGYERWSSHLFFSPRILTQGNFSTTSLSLINSSNVNTDISVVTPIDETDNYMKLFTSNTLLGESVIVVNGSQTIDIKLLGTPLHHHFLLGIDSYTVPYIIPAGKAVRFTKGPSDFYFIAEVISYQ